MARVFASFVVYLGFTAAGVGAVSALVPLAFLGIHRRSSALVLLAAGLLVACAGFAWSARERRVGGVATRLDEFAPVYQFHERHSTRVRTSAARTYQAVREVTADEIALFRALTWIRRMGRESPESILNAPGGKPILDVATETSFLVLAEEPGREIVIGTVVAAPPGWRPRGDFTPQAFRDLAGPGFAIASMNFRVEEATPGICTVTTETRVFATDPASARRFAIYWRVIYPGSALIRRMWLRAVRLRAERSTG